MKTQKKLSLNKQTISRLIAADMKSLKGGYVDLELGYPVSIVDLCGETRWCHTLMANFTVCTTELA